VGDLKVAFAVLIVCMKFLNTYVCFLKGKSATGFEIGLKDIIKPTRLRVGERFV